MNQTRTRVYLWWMILMTAGIFLWMMPVRAELRLIREGAIMVAFPPGQESLAQETVQLIQEGLHEFKDRLPDNGQPIQAIICDTGALFSQYAGKYGRTSVGGVAKSEAGIMVLKSPMMQLGNSYGMTVRHELIHILLARNTHYANLPRWLNEGIAMTVSKEKRWHTFYLIGKMYLTNRIIPYRELDFAFASPGNETEFTEAYAEGLSLTRYLMDRIPPSDFWKMIRLLKTQEFDVALKTVAGVSPGQLWQEWHKSLWKIALITSGVSGFTGFQIAAVLMVLAYWRRKQKDRVIIQRWEEEEGFYGVARRDQRGEGEDWRENVWSRLEEESEEEEPVDIEEAESAYEDGEDRTGKEEWYYDFDKNKWYQR